MTTIQGRLVMRPARSRRRRFAGLLATARVPYRLVYALPFLTGATGMAVALASLLSNDTDVAVLLLLPILAASLAIATIVSWAFAVDLDAAALTLVALLLVASGAVVLLPEWFYGANVSGIVHRTVFSGPVLVLFATATTTLAMRRILGGTPTGQDVALVPLLGVPILIAVSGYAAVLGRIIVAGVGSFDVKLLTTPWRQIPTEGGFTYDLGFLNNILGTFLLIALTLAFAILPGIGAGVFMSEYPGRIARVIRFCATMLRAIAMFIIGVAALGLVVSSGGLEASSFLSGLVRGSYFDGTDVVAERGSFVLAAVFLAVLVMPVIARLTEEGLRSVPREMREGTVALGATDGYGLRRILLPWAAPNILTALILAGAEAGGALAIIMFLAVPGQNGVGLFNGVTTLDYAVFAAKYGPRVYWDSMRNFQSTAALLLLAVTVGLTLVALVIQRRFAARYRGSITVA